MGMRTMKEFRAGADDDGRRLDRVLRILLDRLSLSEIYGALRKKSILVNGSKAEPSLRLAEGDTLLIDTRLCPGISAPRGPGAGSTAFDLGTATLFRSPDILVLNKPRGLATHGQGSLEAIVRGAETEASSSSLAFVPGPLHRLDRNTSGALAFSLGIRGARDFTAALREGLVSKTYLALVDGEVAGEEVWEDELVRDEDTRITRAAPGGAFARSRARPLAISRGKSLLAVGIDTGRTHQIRAQASLHGHPLCGDAKYGGSAAAFYVLHAYRLDFLKEILPGLPLSILAPLPEDSRACLLRSLGPLALEALEALEQA
jgi:23S rRNA pseudouridine955/2504/2580 synthase